MSEAKTIEQSATPTAPSGREEAYSTNTQLTQQLTAAWAKLKETADAPEIAEAAKEREPDRRFEKDRDPVKDPLPKGEKDKIFSNEKTPEPQAKKAEAKPSAKVDSQAEAKVDDFPENVKSEEAKSSWQKLKAARDEAAQKAAALEAEILAIKQQFDPDAFKKTKDENLQLTEALRKLNVEMHPKFKETFDAPIENAVNRAKKFVPSEYHVEVDKWLKAPESPERDAALQAITESLPIHKQAAFVRHVEDASMAIEKKQAALQDERSYVQKWEQDQKAAQETQRIQAEAFAKNTFQNVLKSKFSDNPIFQGEDSEKNIKAAQDLLFGNNPPEVLAEAVLYAQYGREVAPLLQKAHDELVAAYAQIDKLTSKSMGKASAGSSDAAPKDMWSAIREAMAA